jgi:uncharacterized protein (TIGR00369 family)
MTLPPDQLAELQARTQQTMVGALRMEYLEAGPDRMVIRMPITDAVRQPAGILHGGATVALAETAASLGTWLGIDQTKHLAAGLEINCNHLRQVRDGAVTATATPAHRGRTTWVWDIRVHDDAGRLTAIARCTIAVAPLERGG